MQKSLVQNRKNEKVRTDSESAVNFAPMLVLGQKDMKEIGVSTRVLGPITEGD